MEDKCCTKSRDIVGRCCVNALCFLWRAATIALGITIWQIFNSFTFYKSFVEWLANKVN